MSADYFTTAGITREQLAASLARDGYLLPNVIGSEWEDPQVTWLPPGHRSVVAVTSIGKTITGWQCGVMRRQVDRHWRTVESGDGSGRIYLDHLLQHYRRMTS